MTEPVWLEYDEITELHADLIAEFGGLSGVKAPGAIESTLARPKNLLAYGSPDIFALAASLSFGFAKNHCFHDGNKRISQHSAFVFLYDNGYELIPGPAVGPTLFEGLAGDKVTEEELAAILKENCAPVPPPVTKT